MNDTCDTDVLVVGSGPPVEPLNSCWSLAA
jgi:hypothetical protein